MDSAAMYSSAGLLIAILGIFAVRGTNLITGPMVSFCGIALGLILARLSGRWITRQRWYDGLQRNSMGIYLFHPMFNYCVFWLLKDAGIHPWVQTAVAFPVVLALSWISSEGLRKCRLGMLMGE